MLFNTKGIVFRSIKYAETSLILDIYTLDFGLESYIVGGVRKPRAKIKSAVMQLLSIVDLVAYRGSQNKLMRIKEARLDYVFKSIPFDIRKSAVSLFLAELCSKSIKTAEGNPDFFDFLRTSIENLDTVESGFANMHLLFMLQLSRHLGFSPAINFSDQTPHFDLMEGKFVARIPQHKYFVENADLLGSLIRHDENPSYEIHLNRKTRSLLLDQLILYYRLHLEDMRELQSHKILREVI